jgi:hypothetical protein
VVTPGSRSRFVTSAATCTESLRRWCVRRLFGCRVRLEGSKSGNSPFPTSVNQACQREKTGAWEAVAQGDLAHTSPVQGSMSIIFRGVAFTDPVPLATWRPPPVAGLYVVLVEDHRWGPRPFRPIYFGESGNLLERGFPWGHHASGSWLFAARDRLLWIAVSPWPGSTPAERRAFEAVLIREFAPECNR